MRRLLIAIGAVSLLACGGDASGPGNDSAEGTWNLISINDFPLPFTTNESLGYRYEIVSDQFVAHSGGAWNDDFTYRVTQDGVVTTTTESQTGTWAQSGSIVTVTTSAGSVTDVSISGDRITLSGNGVLLIYARD